MKIQLIHERKVNNDLDPAHATVTFYVRHLRINTVAGTVKDFAGALVLGDDMCKAASGTLQVKLMDTASRSGMTLCAVRIFRRGQS